MGGHTRHVRARVGGRGRHRALRCHRVAVEARRQVRAVPDLPQRTLALRAAPESHRSRLPLHVRGPDARSKDAAVTSTLGLRALAVLAVVALKGATKADLRAAFQMIMMLATPTAPTISAPAQADSPRGVAGRHSLGRPDRRVRWPDSGRSSVSDAAHRGIANGVSGSGSRSIMTYHTA